MTFDPRPPCRTESPRGPRVVAAASVSATTLVRFWACAPVRLALAIGPLGKLALDGIDWVIYGGESGPSHRQHDLAWARDMRDRCAAARAVVGVERSHESTVVGELPAPPQIHHAISVALEPDVADQQPASILHVVKRDSLFVAGPAAGSSAEQRYPRGCPGPPPITCMPLWPASRSSTRAMFSPLNRKPCS